MFTRLATVLTIDAEDSSAFDHKKLSSIATMHARYADRRGVGGARTQRRNSTSSRRTSAHLWRRDGEWYRRSLASPRLKRTSRAQERQESPNEQTSSPYHDDADPSPEKHAPPYSSFGTLLSVVRADFKGRWMALGARFSGRSQ